MKVSLNKEMIEKIKSLKGKMVLVPATFALVAGITLTGCGNVDAVEPTTPVTSEVVSEEVSEIVSENEVSEEISEEVVEEETYSAQEVMTLIDNLTAQYQYNDPEHIKALVIAANLDYITEEDLDTILTTYGYTMDDLSALYDACANDNALSMGDTIKYYSGEVDSVSPEREYANRIALSDVMLNESDKEFAVSFDEDSRLAAQFNNDADMRLAEMTNSEYSTSGEQVVVNFAYASFYGPTMENPYAAYQNTMAK